MELTEVMELWNNSMEIIGKWYLPYRSDERNGITDRFTEAV